MKRLFILLTLMFLLSAAVSLHAQDQPTLDTVGRPLTDVTIVGPETRVKVDLPGAKDNVKVVRLADGSVAYVVKRLGSDRDRVLTPDEFTKFLYESRTRAGWLETVFNITSPVGILWVSVGLLGQILFTGRMLIQWFASEKSGRSVIPVAFWWMSLIGATMLLIYFIWRRDIVGVLGQATGWGIYVRNLVLIRRSRGG
ncbi:MAG: lipid-A-disaccharide synthase N-terminal domain-containing protein [Chthoniobacterales bacterium]